MSCCKPLYHKYPGQYHAQDAYLEITEDEYGEVSVAVGVNMEIGNAVPAKVWHGVDIRIGIPNLLSQGEIDALLEEVKPIAETIIANSKVEWDGSNIVRNFLFLGEETKMALEYKLFQMRAESEPCYDTEGCEYCREVDREMYGTDEEEGES
jgi:hypothetical protein